MTSDQRTAWLTSVRAVLDAVETHPDLPQPLILHGDAEFWTPGWGAAARQAFAAAEAALAGSLGVTFAGGIRDSSPGDGYYYALTATMPGLTVVIKAVAGEVAEQKVTGQTVTEITEWVRRPAETPEDDGQGEDEEPQ